MPRNTAVFGPTFRGERTVRSDDITKDPRFGKNPPYRGMPPGHLRVRSYMAVPVVSRSGEVLGGLFFGHETPGVFTERAESLIAGIAAYAAIAIDNARLYQAAQREIERRKQVEEALREGRERLRAALEASGTGTFRWDFRTDALEWDEALNRLFGLPPGETVRRLDQFLALVHPDDRAGVVKRCARCASDGADFAMEFRVVWPDGRVHWLYDRGKTFRDKEGRLAYMTGACVDITDRKRAEEALHRLTEGLERRIDERTRELANANAQLRRERALSELLIESSIGGIAAVDRELRYTLFNPAMERMTGVPRAEVLGKVIFEAFPFLKSSPAEAAWRRAVERQEPSRVQDMRYVVRRSGREGYYEASYSPLYGSDGECIGALALVRDSTEQRRMEEALNQAQRLEAIGQLTGGVAHDFNNLLMVVGGNLELMKQQCGNPERVIDAIERAIARGQSLTRQLLSFSRRHALQPTVLDLHARTPKLIDLLRPSLRGDIEIVTDVAEDVWPVEVDPSELELALLNIGVNARDAMPAGGTLTVSIRNERLSGRLDGLTGDFVRVAVTDTGTGIPADILGKVFEPFFTTKEVGKGTGLGLSQVYGFAKQSGGATSVDSEVGRGTTVTLFLPRSTRPLLPASLEAAVQAPRPTTATVLVVEDNDEVAEITSALLEYMGCRVEHVHTAGQALERLGDGEDFDLVLTDIIMPGGMNGLDLARAVRQRFPSVPVLLTTGYSAAAQQAATEGFTILPKPYQRKALESAVRAILERQQREADAIDGGTPRSRGSHTR
jgi:PAS domain S-box-containing protein